MHKAEMTIRTTGLTREHARNIALLTARHRAENFRVALHIGGNIVSSLFTVLNETADSRMIDLRVKLRNDGLLRKEAKVYFKRAHDALRGNIRAVRDCYQENKASDLYCDFVDHASEKLAKHVEILLMTIVQAVTRAGGEHTRVLSEVETVRVLLELTCATYDELFRTIAHRHGEDVSDVYERVRPTAAWKWWKELSTLSERWTKAYINLKDDEQVQTAVKVLQNKLISLDFVKEGMDYAFGLHPEYIERAERETGRKIDMSLGGRDDLLSVHN